MPARRKSFIQKELLRLNEEPTGLVHVLLYLSRLSDVSRVGYPPLPVILAATITPGLAIARAKPHAERIDLKSMLDLPAKVG